MKHFKDEWALKIGKVARKSKFWKEEKNVCRKSSLVNREEKMIFCRRKKKHLFAVAEILHLNPLAWALKLALSWSSSHLRYCSCLATDHFMQG